MELSSSKIKKFLTFPEMENSNLILILYFRGELSKLQKKKISQKKFLIFQTKELSSPKNLNKNFLCS